MRIKSLEIRNFKAIKYVSLDELADLVLIAGPNGCGKSCVLDAIRLLTSFYTSFTNENYWHSYFGEMNIQVQNLDEWWRLFNDRSKPVIVSSKIEFAEGDVEYIRSKGRNSLYKMLWQQNLSREQPLDIDDSNVPNRLRDVVGQLTELTDRFYHKIISSLDQPTQEAHIIITTDLKPQFIDNPALRFCLSVNDPTNVGIIDYHGPNRHYQRERIGQINVNIQETTNKIGQRALFNQQGRYTNIKSELAAAYVRDLFAERAGSASQATTSILQTLQELFSIFLPGKKFLGPVPSAQGELSFPVVAENGNQYDIDDLSSGEKELIYGYLRLRNAGTRNSIIMLDEPELHLNPRLVLGLPDFYRKNIGVGRGNQLWMVTHSDAFLRDAYSTGGMSLFHMTASEGIDESENQVIPIEANSALDQAIVALVGDIATLRHNRKVLILESTTNASFDATVLRKLFPDFASKVTIFSGDNKQSVRQLFIALRKAAQELEQIRPLQIFAIVDKDSDSESANYLLEGLYEWPAYHIENFLLDNVAISRVLDDNTHFATGMPPAEVDLALAKCAADTLPKVVEHQLRACVNRRLRNYLDLGYDPRISDPAKGLAEAVQRVSTRIGKATQHLLSQEELSKRRAILHSEMTQALADGSWRIKFPGREILSRFAGHYLAGVPYQSFRDQIIGRMVDAGIRPKGMIQVIDLVETGESRLKAENPATTSV